MGPGNYGHVTLHFLSVFQSRSLLFIRFSFPNFTFYKSICSPVTFISTVLGIHFREEETSCLLPTIQLFIGNSRQYSLLYNVTL